MFNISDQNLSKGSGASDANTQRVVIATDNTVIGIVTETAPASDTASSGLNGRLQRIAQNITTLIASTLAVAGNVASGASDSGNPVKVGGRFNTAQPTLTNGQRGDLQLTSAAALIVSDNTITKAAGTSDATTQRVTIASDNAILGIITETAPASDTASSGLNGRLQRVAQNITTLIASTLSVGGNVASGATDSGNPVKVGGRYNSTAPTLTNGQRGDLQLDSAGNVLVSLATSIYGEDPTNNVIGVQVKPAIGIGYAPSNYKNAGTVTNANLKATAGNVFSVRATNANAAVRYFQLHNKASAPSAGDTAQLYYLMAAGTSTVPFPLDLDIAHFASSEYFSTGISYAISTTATTFTDAATPADHTVVIRYI